jgi:hypothetical protein
MKRSDLPKVAWVLVQLGLELVLLHFKCTQETGSESLL